MKNRTALVAATLALFAFAGSAANVALGSPMSRRDGTAHGGHRKGMKVTSAIFETMSGKIGGAVASKARGGIKYLRALVTPSNPKSSRQNFMRAALTGVAAAWTSTLTSAQRAAWTALSADNESGIDVYCGNNAQVIRAGLARVDVAPNSRAVAFAFAPSILNDEYDDHDEAATITIPNGKRFLATGSHLNVYASSGNQRPSRLAQQYPFQFITSIVADGATTSPTVNLYDFLARPWAPGTVDGDHVGYVRLVGVKATGEVTGELTFAVTNNVA